MKTTPSFFQVQLGVDMDLEPYREGIKRLNFIYPYPDIDRAMANFPNGNVEEAAFYLYVATLHQPEMAPPGAALDEARVPDAARLEGDRLGARQGLDRGHLHPPHRGDHPRSREHIVVRRDPDPADLARDTGNSEGAFAGWAFTPELLTRAAAAAHAGPRPLRAATGRRRPPGCPG